MKSFSNNRPILLALTIIFWPLILVSPVEASEAIAVKPNFQGKFQSRDISSSGTWILEFKFENGQWSGLAKLANGKWAKIDGVKVNGNKIEFYMGSVPISKFKATIDGKNILISGTQEIGDGRKNTFNNFFMPFTATRI